MGLKSWFKSLFDRFVRAFRSFLDEALPIAVQFVMGQLKDITTLVVQEMSVSNLDNEAKRKEAFRRIREYAVKNAISGATDSVINTMIELAVQKMKNEFDK